MFSITPFNEADLVALDIDYERYDPMEQEIDITHWRKAIIQRTDSQYTIWTEQGIVGILFGWFVGRSAAEICILIDKKFRDISLQNLKRLKKAINEILEAEHRIRKVYRFQAMVTTRVPEPARFMEFLGFKKEHVLEKFELGKYDSLLYRKFYGIGIN